MVFWTLFVGAMAAPQEEPALQDITIGTSEGRPVRVRRVTEIPFDDPLKIGGALVRPQEVFVPEVGALVFHPLIRTRQHWNEEITESLTRIR